MIPQDGWSEEKLYSYQPGYYILNITSEFPWKEEFRAELERYALKRIADERKRDPGWKNPLEIQLHWKTLQGEYRNILFSDLSERSATRKLKGGWALDALYTYKPGYWIIKISVDGPCDDDFKEKMKNYVFEHTNRHGFEDPLWIELQCSQTGKMLEKFVLYEQTTS